MKIPFLSWGVFFFIVQMKTVCCLNFQLKFMNVLHGNSTEAKRRDTLFYSIKSYGSCMG